MFGFKLASTGSNLFLGGTDTSKYTGSIEYHSIDQSTGFWQAPNAHSVVGSKTANSNFETIIDSGTTIMYGPPSAVKAFYAAIRDYSDLASQYAMSCRVGQTCFLTCINGAFALLIPAALAATCAFMLPVATPPNAIAYGSGYVSIPMMIKGGIGLNLIGLVLITAVTMTLAVWVFGIAF